MIDLTVHGLHVEPIPADILDDLRSTSLMVQRQALEAQAMIDSLNVGPILAEMQEQARWLRRMQLEYSGFALPHLGQFGSSTFNIASPVIVTRPTPPAAAEEVQARPPADEKIPTTLKIERPAAYMPSAAEKTKPAARRADAPRFPEAQHPVRDEEAHRRLDEIIGLLQKLTLSGASAGDTNAPPPTLTESLRRPECAVLRVLRDKFPLQLFIIDLAANADISRSTCGRVVAGLESRGLVERVGSRKERKGVKITPAGASLVNAIDGGHK